MTQASSPAALPTRPDRIGDVPAQIYLGLGGVGGQIVDRIAWRLDRNPEWSRYRKGCTGFMAIDTNYIDLQKLEKRVPFWSHIAPMERGQILQYLKEQAHPWLTSWLDDDYLCRPSSPGAGQIRLESRVSSYVVSGDIQNQMKAMLSSMLDSDNPFLDRNRREVDVFVFGSLAGGTGSGCFLTMAYMLREVIRARGWVPHLFGHFLTATSMERFVPSALHRYVHANTYAALKELEALTQAVYQSQAGDKPEPVHFVYRQPDRKGQALPVVEEPPYDWIALVDEPEAMALDSILDAVADGAYLYLHSPARPRALGSQDNYTRFRQRLVGVSNQTTGGSTCHYGTFGAAALVVPEERMLEYCSLRFAAEGLQRQLTLEGATHRGAQVKLARIDRRLDGLASDRIAPEEKQRIVNQAWAEKLVALAGLDLKDEKVGRAGIWASIVESVDGPSSNAGPQKKKETPAFLKKSAPVAGEAPAASQKPLREAVRQELQDDIRLISKLTPTSPDPVSAQTVRSWARRLDDACAALRAFQAEAAITTRRLAEEELEGTAIEDVRRSRSFDAITERYLVLQLIADTESWLAEARKTRITHAQASPENADAVNDLKEITTTGPIHAALNKGTISKAWDKVKTLGSGKQLDVLLDAANQRVREWFQSACAFVVADAEVRQLESFLLFLQKRAALYGEVGLAARARAARVKREASLMLDPGYSLGDEDFALKIEALRPLEENRPRMWDRFWELVLVPRIQHLFDPGQLGQTVSEQFKPQLGRRKLHERTPEEIVDGVLEALKAQATEALAPHLRGLPGTEDRGKLGLTLDQALEWEARIGCCPADATVTDLEKVSDAAIDVYLINKLRALRALADPLARLDHGEMARPERPFEILNEGYLVHDPLAVEGALKRALRVLTDRDTMNAVVFQPDAGKERLWDDPRVMILYRALAVLPLYFFPVVREEREVYLRILNSPCKPHDLHTDVNWEYTLPDLDPLELAEEEERARNLLLRGLSAGVVHRTGTSARASWVWDDGHRKEDRLDLGPDPRRWVARIQQMARLPGQAQQFDAALAGVAPDPKRVRGALAHLETTKAQCAVEARKANRPLRGIESLDALIAALKEDLA